MIDIKLIRDEPDLVKENIKKKFQDAKVELVDEVLKLDGEWRRLKFQADNLRKDRNKISKEVNRLKKSGDEKGAKDLISKAKKIPERIKNIENRGEKLERKIKNIMMKIPNMIHPSVPIGKDDTENVEIAKFGKAKKPSFKVMNHAELAEKICGVDFEVSGETSGTGFYYLMGELAILHSAMLSFARDFMIKQGFRYVIPPFMIRKKVVEGVMSFEEMENMMYKVEGEDLYLIGTSEHSVIGKFIDKNLRKKDLPVCLTSYSPCFRKEIGAHGIEERGFYRRHQFEKQEMIVICKPEESFEWYDKMLNWTIEVFKELEIPVRTLEICSGDLADLKAKSADVEAWSPRRGEYFEVGSCSNLTSAQARRLNIKFNDGSSSKFVHTLNNTVLASPRALVAFLENHQQKDGSINIPKALWKYTGFKVIKMKNW